MENTSVLWQPEHVPVKMIQWWNEMKTNVSMILLETDVLPSLSFSRNGISEKGISTTNLTDTSYTE